MWNIVHLMVGLQLPLYELQQDIPSGQKFLKKLPPLSDKL